MSVPLYLAAAFGLAFGLMNDKMPGLAKLRASWGFADRLLQCSYCTGFHCGWIVWVLGTVSSGTMPASLLGGAATAVVWGMASAASCYLADTAAQWLERSARDGT